MYGLGCTVGGVAPPRFAMDTFDVPSSEPVFEWESGDIELECDLGSDVDSLIGEASTRARGVCSLDGSLYGANARDEEELMLIEEYRASQADEKASRVVEDASRAVEEAS